MIASALSCPAVAVAQTDSLHGPYFAPAISAVNHHFVVEETVGSSITERNVSDWGAGGAAIAGYSFDLGNNLILGVEGQVSIGGASAETMTPLGVVGLDPQWGYSATVRLGRRISGDTIVYAGGGFGGHRYEVTTPAAVTGFGNWNRSFVLVGGVETPISRRIRTRLEFQHLDGTRNEVLLAFPIRF